ncbi:putative hydroxypyruvate isomerase isoform 2-T2 [Aulostomus maculatus]
MAVHRVSRLQPENIRGCLSRFSGSGSSLALRLGSSGAPESPGGNRNGGGPHQYSPRIHLMAGRIPVASLRTDVAKDMETVFVQNLIYAADVLSKEGITGMIEPINSRITDPRYFLDSPHQAAAILERVGKPNIKLQMDVFHWEIMDRNLTQNIHKYFPLIGHIQIAQVPGRNEPDSVGDLDFKYLFNMLEKLSYQGYIGCEYKPAGSTHEGLGWLKDYWTHSK